MPTPDPQYLTTETVRRAFERARPSELSLTVYRNVAERMAEHLEPIRIDPSSVLDVGTGPGTWLTHLRAQFPNAHIVASDLLPQRLSALKPAPTGWRPWRRRPNACAVSMDAGNLALSDASVDLVTSNAMVHWLSSLPAFLRSARRVLRPEGLLLISTFGPQTLTELRTAWQHHDPNGVHIHPLPDMHDIGDQLVRAGFTDVVMDSERLTLTYADPSALLTDLRALEVTNLAHQRPRALTTPRRLDAVRRTYTEEVLNRAPEPGRIKATVELVFAHAWAPLEDPGARSRDALGGLGSVNVAAPHPPPPRARPPAASQ